MTRPASARRLLQTNSGQFPAIPAADPPDPLAVDSDVVVILAALLCALICVVGLAAVARCARSRRSTNSAASTGGGRGPDAASAGAPNKGLKKKALKALPKLAYEDAVAAVAAVRGGGAGEETLLAECPICLSEFGEEEEIRILPQCGHGFHVACVDTWLGAHSSCPSCRRVLVVDPPKATPPPPPTPTPKQCRKGDATGTSSSRSGGAASSFLP